MTSRNSLRVAFAAVASLACVTTSAVSIDFVTVGAPNNAADSTGYGAVTYEYRIGAYEVTIGQWTEFLNAVAASDPWGLYNPAIASPQLVSAGISRSGVDGSYTYSVMDNPTGQSSANRAVTHVNFFAAARFANWLHNGQGSGDTESGAYRLVTGGLAGATRTGGVSTFTTSSPTALQVGDQVSVAGFTNGGASGTRFNVTGIVTGIPSANQFTMASLNGDAVADGVGTFTGIAPSHSPGAKFWIPTEDEWYKAAYYDPSLNGGVGGYFQYATSSNSPPGKTIGALPNQANWTDGGVYAVGPTPLNTAVNYLADVGSYSQSASPSGAFDMTGSVREWTAAIAGTSLNSPGSSRMWRGGGWNDGASRSVSSYRDEFPSSATSGFSTLGFRLAAALSGPALPGDFNQDGSVNAADYTVWRDNLGGDPASLGGNSNGDTVVDALDYELWRQAYGDTSVAFGSSIPEPSALLLAGAALMFGYRSSRH